MVTGDADEGRLTVHYAAILGNELTKLQPSLATQRYDLVFGPYIFHRTKLQRCEDTVGVELHYIN